MKIQVGMTVKNDKNPVIPGMGVCDPHLKAYEGRLYLFCSHDKSQGNEDYCTEDWHIWSSTDFREWRLDQIVRPDDFYMGPSNFCWATDSEEKNGKYYFYYSNKNRQTGVAVADCPQGPYKDAEDSPILDGTRTNSTEYDPAVFTDEDGVSYLVFGGPKWAYGETGGYYIARLSEDMIHLGEQPRRLLVDHEADDKASLNKIGGTYYLTWGSYYAVSSNVYGPYRCLGNTGVSEDHGSFLEYQGQLFHSFTIFDPTMEHRASGICYVHQRENRELVADEMIVEYGVGHYDARWNKIQSQWYMKGVGIRKVENPRYGFDVLVTDEGSVCYPNTEHTQEFDFLSFFASCSSHQGGEIQVREEEGGEILASCELWYTGSLWRSYRMFPCGPLPRGIKGLYITLKVKGQGQIRLDYFKFFKKEV